MVDALLGNSQAHLHPFVTSLPSRKRAGETMKNKYIRRLSMTFYFVFSLYWAWHLRKQQQPLASLRSIPRHVQPPADSIAAASAAISGWITAN